MYQIVADGKLLKVQLLNLEDALFWLDMIIEYCQARTAEVLYNHSQSIEFWYRKEG